MSDVHSKSMRGWGFILLLFVMGGTGMLIRSQASEPVAIGFRTVAALLLVLGLTFIGVHLARRWSQRAGLVGAGPAQPIHVLGVKGLGNGQSLLVVEVAGERFLLGASREKVVHLARLSAQDPASDAGPSAGEGG